ncbi:MAG: hypothetical protein ACRBN8_02730 [Nannocystales bacterium]
MRQLRPVLLAVALGAFSVACAGTGAADSETDADGPVVETESTGTPTNLQSGPCARIVDCAADTDRPVTRLIAQYGEDGMCWDEFPKEACWQDCRAILSDAACGETDLCCECETAADCAYDPERPLCLAGSCAAQIGGSDTDEPSDMGDDEFPATEFLVLLSLSASPQTPIQLVGTVANEDGLLSLDLQYLALNVGSNSEPRTPTGQFLRTDVPVAEDGTFEFSVDGAAVSGAANPINGSDIVMSISVAGQVTSDRICGALSGSVTVPTNTDLSGSAFSGIPVGAGDLPAASSATCG